MSANRLLIYTGNSTIDSEADYGVVVLESSGHDTQEVKNLSSQEWKDENGEEVYMPKNGVNFKAYDVTLTLGVKSTDEDNARNLKDTFIDAIKSKELAVKQDFFDYTLVGAYLTKVEEVEYYKEYMLFKVVFKVTKPTEEFVMPSRDPYYDEPIVSFEYAPGKVPSSGGTWGVRTKSYRQVKHIPLQDGTERTEIITSGGEWSWKVEGSNAWEVNVDRYGTLTFPESSHSTDTGVYVTGSVTMNGKTGSKTLMVFQQARQNVSPFFVGQINVTAKQFANLSTQFLLDYSTQISQQLTHETETTMWSYFFMLPEDVEFVSLQYLSSGVVSEITSLADFNLKHDDVVIGEHTYKVYGMRTSPGERYLLTIRRV